MFRLLACASLLTGMFAFALPAAERDDKDKVPKVEIAKRGKAATAFVEISPKGGSGTAFCVHPSGLFVTNEHVVRTAGDDFITLVLNPSLDAQKILKAKVVRIDKAADLALLRAADAADLPSLHLGAVDAVAELAEVVVCGFPLGAALATEKKEYPAVSVNAGSVTSLRLKGGQLQFIQIDAALTFGNSGGPVLDDAGKVIGVVVSGRPGTGINQAIPVNILDRFLKAPDLAFTPPELTRANLDKPMEFKANVVSFIPKAPEPTLKLILLAGDQEPREFPMKKQDGLWVTTAAPAATATAARVELSARFGTADITGTTDDVVFKVGDKPVRLSGVRRIEFKSKASVLLADGRTTLEGDITKLRPVEIDLAGQKVKIDLAKATQLIVQPTPEIVSVIATVVASVEDKEVARTEARMLVREATRVAPADVSSVVITPPALTDDKVVKKLPDMFTDVVVGGGGRYLIFNLAKLKKLAVFDVNEARITKYIPVAEDDITFTAGLDCVVIGLKQANRLERWSLTTFELEKSSPPPFNEDITGVLMGHASKGPLVVNGFFLDLATFKMLPILSDKGSERPLGSALGRYASGDGTVFGSWKSNQSPVETSTFVYEGGVVKRYEGGDLRHAIPGADGRSVYTAKGVASRTLDRGDRDDAMYGYCLPAMRGDYFLSLSSANAGKGGGFTVYLRGLKQPIAKLDKAEYGLTFDGWDREGFGPWKRVFFVPDAKVIAVLPPSNDQVVLYKFDADAALEKSGLDYLIITSQPPAEVKAGTNFTYTIKTKSKDKMVTFRLDNGPKGMAVSATGVVTWPAPADASEGKQEVILTVRTEAGQEVFHIFTVQVLK
jgi:S1-C subfamily serine protease